MKSGGKSAAKTNKALAAVQVATLGVVLLAGFLAGCAGYVKGIQTQIQAAFQLNPTSVSFGKVGVGKQTTQTIAVTNTGNTAVSITQVSLSNPQFSLPGAVFPMALATGQSTNMTVAVTPTAAGTVTGTMTAQGNNGSSPVTVNLSATAINPAPQISLSSTSVQLGTVALGSTSNSTVTISNVGTADLTLSVISLTGAEFGVSGIATPKTISAGTSTTAILSFQPTSAGAVSGTLTITSNDPTTPAATITLNGTGTTTATATLQANPASVNFGNVALGGSATQNITITNTGTAGVQISGVAISGAGMSGSGITTPLFLNPSATATVAVRFAPTTAGSVTGSLTIASNATGSPMTIPLTGTGGQAGLSISPASFAYGSVTDGQTKSQSFTLSNTGNAPLTISQLAVSGTGFSINGLTTPATVAVGGSTTFNAVFAPTTAGNLAGTVTVTSNAPNSPATIALSGTGVAATGSLTFSTNTVSFGNVNTGSSAAQNVTITNTSNASVQISQVAVSGAGFTATGIVTPLTLNPTAAATLSVKFAPTFAGGVAGSVTVTSNGAGSPQIISVSGTGIQAALGIAPASFAYGSVTDGQTKSQSFTLTNTGTASLTISQIAVSGAGYSVNGLATPTTLAAGANATFNAVFAPTTAGSLAGTVTITSNAAGSPATISLSGTGVATTTSLTANPTSLSFGNINAGSSSSQNVTLTNAGNSNLTISQVTVSATDTTTSGMTLPLTLTPGQTQTMSVTFSPKAQETVSGNITVSTAQGSSAVVAVTGTGLQAKLTLTPSSANLGTVTVGSSNSQTIQVSNPGNALLTISQANVSGTGFSAAGLTLPLSVNPGSSSTFNVVFQPTVAGSASGSLSIVSNAAGSPATMTLSGTGVTATQTLSFSTTGLSFGNVNIGSSSTNGVTITNTGNSNVQISGITVSGTGYTLSGASAPVTLTPSQTLTFSVIFTPTTATTLTGSVTVTSNATGSPATITLSGMGVTPVTHTVSLSWTASTTTGVAGYNVYRSTTSGSGYVKLNGALVTPVNYTDSSVSNGATYYYVTTAVDGSGNESTYSNQATAVIP